MKIRELQPLKEKVALLHGNPSVIEVFEYVTEKTENANTAAMAQSACDAIATMCHPRAWGDLNVQGFSPAWTDWLQELKATAIACGQAIYDNHVGQE